jgi:uncharacterized membrane protein YjgN (DUF898 family)
MKWFYKDGDQEIGPISKADIQNLIHARRITAETLIRREDMDGWQPLAKMVRSKSKTQENQSQSGHPWNAHPPPEKVTQTPTTAPEMKLSDEMPFEFKGIGGEYFKIWIVNILLSIITLGIYSAWAKVRRKQYFYGNTHITGAVFRYLADPVKILKGRLIVFFLFVVYSIIHEFFPVIGALLALGFIFLLPWLVVRSLAFNARNSSLRNIRFNFTGTYGQAAKVYILFPLLGAVTLGILSPYAYYRQKKFIVENSAYGTTDFCFQATPKDYYRLLLAFLIPLVIFIALVAIASALVPPLTVILFMLFYLYALAYFSVKSSNLLFSSTTLSDHRFRLRMELKAYSLIIFTNTLATVCTLGLFYPFAQIRATKYKIKQLTLLPGSDLNQFVAAKLKETNALGDEISDFMDFDFGF